MTSTLTIGELARRDIAGKGQSGALDMGRQPVPRQRHRGLGRAELVVGHGAVLARIGRRRAIMVRDFAPRVHIAATARHGDKAFAFWRGRAPHFVRAAAWGGVAITGGNDET